MHPIRERLMGASENNDRLWLVTLPDGSAEALTDYNWEVTGRTKRLSDGYGIRYSDSAYYWTDELVRRGCKVENVEDRR